MDTTETPPIPPEILGAALALSEAQRLALGYRLIESVGSVDPDAFGVDWPEDWEKELDRRALAIERGEPTIAHEDFMARLRESLDQASEVRQTHETVNP